MRARGIGLGFAHHQHPRHFICPGLGVIHISRETPRRQHAKRRAAAFNASASPTPIIQTGPYQYTAPTVRSNCESAAAEEPAVPIDNVYSDEGFVEGFLYSPETESELAVNPYQECC
jgi:hypothetical protein